MLRTLPPLREELSLLPGPVLADGQPSWTLHDPIRGQFFRLDWSTFEILRRWQLRDPDLIARAIAASTTLQIGVADVSVVNEFLAENQLIQSSGPAAPALMAQRLERLRGTAFKRLLHHYLFFRVPLVRPDAWLQRWLPIARFFFSRPFFLLTVAALVTGLAQVAQQAGTFFGTLVTTFNASGLLIYGLALIGVKALHELGHAFAARHHGCRVPTMGVAFLVLWPVAYTDTNETWKLTDRSHRLSVAIAGIATELAIGAWALLAWAFLPDGDLRSIAFVLTTTSLLATLAINASPFMRFDGYFILCDLLDLPNLHGRSFALARWKIRQGLFAAPEDPPESFPPAAQRALIAFAWATWIYRLILFIGIAVLVYHFFIKVVGIALFVVEIAWFIVLPVTREIRSWQLSWTKLRGRSPTRRRFYRVLAGTAAVLLLVLLPWPGRVETSALLRPAEIWPLYAPGAAQIAEITVQEGAAAEPGTPLLRLVSPEVETRVTLAGLRTNRLRHEASLAGFTPESRAGLQTSRERWLTAQTELNAGATERSRYELVAPWSGVVRDLNPGLQPGQWVAAKEKLGSLIGPGGSVIEAYLTEEQVRHVQPGQEGIFLTDGREGRSLQVRVTAVDADATRALTDRRLTSSAGGTVLVRDQPGAAIPEQAVYRVTLSVETALGDLEGRDWRGTLIIRTASHSSLARYLRQALMVALRESGF